MLQSPEYLLCVYIWDIYAKCLMSAPFWALAARTFLEVESLGLPSSGSLVLEASGLVPPLPVGILPGTFCTEEPRSRGMLS